jgi:hypothetical protein
MRAHTLGSEDLGCGAPARCQPKGAGGGGGGAERGARHEGHTGGMPLRLGQGGAPRARGPEKPWEALRCALSNGGGGRRFGAAAAGRVGKGFERAGARRAPLREPRLLHGVLFVAGFLHGFRLCDMWGVHNIGSSPRGRPGRVGPGPPGGSARRGAALRARDSTGARARPAAGGRRKGPEKQGHSAPTFAGSRARGRLPAPSFKVWVKLSALVWAAELAQFPLRMGRSGNVWSNVKQHMRRRAWWGMADNPSVFESAPADSISHKPRPARWGSRACHARSGGAVMGARAGRRGC